MMTRRNPNSESELCPFETSCESACRSPRMVCSVSPPGWTRWQFRLRLRSEESKKAGLLPAARPEFSRSKSKDQLSERKAKSPGKKERSKDREATKEDRDKESKEPKESKRREKEPKEAKEPKEKETKEKDLKDSKGEEAEEPGGEREPREKSEKDPHEKREKKERKERRKKKKDDAEDAVDDPEA